MRLRFGQALATAVGQLSVVDARAIFGDRMSQLIVCGGDDLTSPTTASIEGKAANHDEHRFRDHNDLVYHYRHYDCHHQHLFRDHNDDEHLQYKHHWDCQHYNYRHRDFKQCNNRRRDTSTDLETTITTTTTTTTSSDLLVVGALNIDVNHTDDHHKRHNFHQPRGYDSNVDVVHSYHKDDHYNHNYFNHEHRHLDDTHSRDWHFYDDHDNNNYDKKYFGGGDTDFSSRGRQHDPLDWRWLG
ncbi:hypothetical protein N657DRAFT_679680 [Parathielavia appendiculata]|uniref:Uncharacterized protein n=1 Tax=Parathielavia appendiculata TaxID=2587402 RepID=A0AAN6Z4N9_9PEZI|nr:hypothetical protein N657DRAFT_679680 [Parathielavia appendiculata]